MEMRSDSGMPFTTHIYLDVREEGVEFSVVDNMLIKPGHEPELLRLLPDELMPAPNLTPDDCDIMRAPNLTPGDYDRGIDIRFWKNGQISLNVALDADQALDFLDKFIESLLITSIPVTFGQQRDSEEIESMAKQITAMIQETVKVIAGG